MTKTHNEIFLKWIEFWHKRGSLIVQNIVDINDPNTKKKKLISAEKILKNKIITDEMKLNISTTVNGYKKGSKTWSGENIEKFNTFFFDIDLWDTKTNKMDLKEAYELIEPYAEQFDFIVQTAHWFHFRILLPDWKYTINDRAQYLSDWLQKKSELEGVLKLTFDPACFRTVQLTRIPGSIHQKSPDPKLTIMKLIKWIEILFPVYETQKMIENIPIRSVLEALEIEYENDSIYENGILTNGRKINIAENYINDFSGKWRPVWSPFSFVKHRFLKYGNLDPKKFDTEAIIKTYWFFTERFGILQSLKKYKTIATPQILERIFLDSRFEWKDIQTLLSLIYYARQYFLIQLPYGNKVSAPISDIIWTTGLSIEISDFVSNLKQLNTKLDNFGIQIKNTIIPIISSKLEKIDDTDRLLEYTILPLWYQTKEYRRAFYWTHYINAKSLEMKTKGKAFLFYMKLCSELLSIVRLTDWEISKQELMKFFEDENFTRIKKKIEKIMTITWDFTITTTWKFIQFQKI